MNTNTEETVTLTKKEYWELRRSAFKLDCLEAGGVDNWDWYDESLKDYYAAVEKDEI